jgi:hypothetical protein
VIEVSSWDHWGRGDDSLMFVGVDEKRLESIPISSAIYFDKS